MGTSRHDIEQWLARGISQGATHVIVVCDCWDYEDYPVFISKNEDVRDEVNARDGVNMQKVMEVYNLSKPLDPQLDQPRSMNF